MRTTPKIKEKFPIFSELVDLIEDFKDNRSKYPAGVLFIDDIPTACMNELDALLNNYEQDFKKYLIVENDYLDVSYDLLFDFYKTVKEENGLNFYDSLPQKFILEGEMYSGIFTKARRKYVNNLMDSIIMKRIGTSLEVAKFNFSDINSSELVSNKDYGYSPDWFMKFSNGKLEKTTKPSYIPEFVFKKFFQGYVRRIARLTDPVVCDMFSDYKETKSKGK